MPGFEFDPGYATVFVTKACGKEVDIMEDVPASDN